MSFKRSDVIPILYFNGTGGHFLASLLYYAKNNIKTHSWNFSEYGNAHRTKKDFILRGPGIWAPVTEHLDAILRMPMTNQTMYIPSHCNDPALALTHLDKIIKTHFTFNDLDEIATVFAVKWGLEEQALETKKLKQVLDAQKRAYSEFANLANEFIDPEHRVLNLSWQEILHAEPDILINKLSAFTAIPYENFSMNHFLKWRELTNRAIVEYKDILL